MYSKAVDAADKLSYSTFYRLWSRNFNIGFANPRVDVCTTCEQLNHRLRQCKDSEKVDLMTQLRIHKLRSKTFYDMLRKRSPDSYDIAYDLQQVHSLPKLPVQEAFYSRQLGLYNFGLCDLSSGKKFCYTWLESDAGRGSVEIGSAVFSYITHELSQSDAYKQVRKLRLFSDGCGGQNKNNNIVAMAFTYLILHAPENVKEIELIFPVRGHSFLPCDRLFGRIEKSLKGIDTITLPSTFHHIFKQHADQVKVLGRDWELFDWKVPAKALRKVAKIQEAKRIFLSKQPEGVVNVRTELFYRVDVGKQAQLHKAMHVPVPEPPTVTVGREIPEAKLTDIHKLLTATYGERWMDKPDLQLYKNLKTTLLGAPDTPNSLCNCCDFDIGMHI